MYVLYDTIKKSHPDEVKWDKMDYSQSLIELKNMKLANQKVERTNEITYRWYWFNELTEEQQSYLTEAKFLENKERAKEVINIWAKHVSLEMANAHMLKKQTIAEKQFELFSERLASYEAAYSQ